MNAKHLETLIKQWHQVAVKNKDWNWKVFLFIRLDWCFEGTCVQQTIQECLDWWLSMISYTPKDIEHEYTDEYKIVTPSPLTLKEWDLVDISENVREYAVKKWRCEEKIDMIGQKWLKIYSVDDWYYWIYIDEFDSRTFPSRAVSLSVSVKVETQELTLEERVKRLEEKML